MSLFSSDTVSVYRVILAEGALVDPAVWKDEIIFRHPAGTFEFFPACQEDLREDGGYPMGCCISCHPGNFLQPLFRGELPFVRTVYCCFAPDADNLDEEAFYPPLASRGTISCRCSILYLLTV